MAVLATRAGVLLSTGRGVLLATTAVVAPPAGIATGASFTAVPTFAIQNVAMTGVTYALTGGAQAWAVLRTANVPQTDASARVALSGTPGSALGLVPPHTGQFTVVICDSAAANSGNDLARSVPFVADYPQTGSKPTAAGQAQYSIVHEYFDAAKQLDMGGFGYSGSQLYLLVVDQNGNTARTGKLVWHGSSTVAPVAGTDYGVNNGDVRDAVPTADGGPNFGWEGQNGFTYWRGPAPGFSISVPTYAFAWFIPTDGSGPPACSKIPCAFYPNGINATVPVFVGGGSLPANSAGGELGNLPLTVAAGATISGGAYFTTSTTARSVAFRQGGANVGTPMALAQPFGTLPDMVAPSTGANCTVALLNSDGTVLAETATITITGVVGVISGSFAGVPATGTAGTALGTAPTYTITNGPASGTRGYIFLYNLTTNAIVAGTLQALATVTGSVPNYTPPIADNYEYAISANPSGVNPFAISSAITVAAAGGAISGTLTGLPTTGTVGQAITGGAYTITNGPSSGTLAYAGLYNPGTGTFDGALQPLTAASGSVPAFTPHAAGSFQIALVTQANGAGGFLGSPTISVTSGAVAPAITLNQPGAAGAGTTPAITAAFASYASQPTLLYSVDGAAFSALPGPVTFSPATGAPSSVSYNQPTLATGAHTIQLKDSASGLLSNTVTLTFTVAGALPTLQVLSQASLVANAPVTFGQPYAKGDVPAGSTPTFTWPGGSAQIPQLDQKSFWSDGSLRFAAHSLRLPNAMTAGLVAQPQLGTTTTAAPIGGALTAAALAAASDWKVKAHGYSYGADTFTVSVNDILANFQDGRAGSKNFGGNALGGWELWRAGPYCTTWRAWRYLKRDSDGASHPWVKADIYISAYPDGVGGLEYEVVPVVKQTNSAGPMPGAAVPITDAASQKPYAGIYELWNGAVLKQSWGNAADSAVIPLTPSGINAATGQIVSVDLRKCRGAGFTLQGANLPQPMPPQPAWMSFDGYLYFTGRKDAFGSGFQGASSGCPAWVAGAGPIGLRGGVSSTGQYVTVQSNGAYFISLNAGNSTVAPQPTNPQGGTFTGADGVQWLQQTVAFSASQPANFQLVPVPFTTPGGAIPLIPASSVPVWQGAAGRDKLVIGHDPTYLMFKSRAVTPLNPGVSPLPNYDPSFGAPYRTNWCSALTGRLSFNATGDGPDDECPGWLGTSPSNLALNPLDPVCEQVVRNLGWSFSDFQCAWEDERTGRYVHGGTKTWPGFIPNPGVVFRLGQPGHGSPGWIGLADNDNWYQGGYGYVVDSSHMPSPFIMNYLRSAHPYFIEQGIAQSFALNNSMTGGRNHTDSLGVLRDYNFLDIAEGGKELRVYAWAMRHHGTVEFLMPQDNPAYVIFKDMMDGVGSYAGILTSELGKNTEASTSFALNLGLIYVSDGIDVTDPVGHDPGPQGVHCFMHGHYATATGMETWRGERPGWRALNDEHARYFVGAFDSQAGGSPYWMHVYTIGIQDAAGQPAYPDWGTAWFKNHYYIQETGLYPGAGGTGTPATGFCEGFGYQDTGGIFLGAISMRYVATGDATALRVRNETVTRLQATFGGTYNLVFPNGSGYFAGHPFVSATYAIQPS